MLGRFAANAVRSWASCWRRTCFVNLSELAVQRSYASEPFAKDRETFYEYIVERRLKAVQSTLAISSYPLKPTRSEFRSWRNVIEVSNFDEALQKHGERLVSAPSWALLYLFSSKVYTPSQAQAAVNIVVRHFQHADKTLQPAFIILTIWHLAKQQVEAPVPNLINVFLMLDLSKPQLQLNCLLQKMSHFKPSPILARATTQVLDAMHGRQIKLNSRTYRFLLSNSLVSLELAKKLQQSMELQGTKPNRHHLEAYLRLFAHHGAVHASARYLNLIRKQAEETGEITPPHGVELSSRGARAIKSEDSTKSHHHTKFLTSFNRHTGSAFQYLRELLDEKDDPAPITPRTARKESRVRQTSQKDRPRVSKKRKPNFADWVAVLNVAARDKSISSGRLLQLFDETKTAAGVPARVELFTVLIRGLAKKGDHATALDVWDRCCASWTRRRRIDTKALTVAMEVIVANGYHLAAFDTLVETTGILHDRKNKPEKLSRTAIGRRTKRALYSKYAKVDVPLVNALMNAYQKNGRPDLVFKLWDVFYPLFRVYPNGNTLTIVLDAAYSVARWDHTFRGLLELLGLHDLFKSISPSKVPIEGKNRHQIYQHVRVHIQHRSSSPSSSSMDDEVEPEHKEAVCEATKYMRKTLWNGELAAPKAIELFQGILLGNFPELKNVTPPARAVWPDEASSASPMRDALSSLGSRLRGAAASEDSQRQDGHLNESVLSSSQILSTSPHPQITPTSQAFASYISLLFSSNQSSQIPLTLAWMRHLGIRPLKRSLAIAIALWSEASMRGPLIERYGGRESEFDKLIVWLRDWLGEEGMPSNVAISWAFRKLREERSK